MALSVPLHIVTGNIGTLGEQLVHSVLAQFQGIEVSIKLVARVHHRQQVEQAVLAAAQTGAIIVHTLVNPTLRHLLIELAAEKQVVTFDVVGPLLEHLSTVFGRDPTGTPGLYRQLHDTYYKRIEAIDYTFAHDDGLKHEDWPQAEIVIVGVSRVGKTPLSMYLSMWGWKVANVPLILDVPPRPALFQLDPRRVIGLTIEPGQLIYHRRHRQARLKAGKLSSYVNPETVYREVRAARQIMRRGGFRTIDVTDKPIEISADEIVELITQQANTLPT